VQKMMLNAVVSVLAFGTAMMAGYFVLNQCRPSPSPQQLGNQLTVMSSSSPLRAFTQVYPEASTEEIFSYVSNAESLPQWMPGLASVTYDHSDSAIPGQLGKGSRRVLMFGEQEETEIITQYEYPNIIAYQITTGVPIKNHLAVMTVTPNKDGGSLLTWHQYFELEWSSPYGLLMPFLVRRFLNDGQAQLIEQFNGEALKSCQHGLLST